MGVGEMNFDMNMLMQTNVSMSLVLALCFVFLLAILWIYQRDSDNNVDVKDLFCTDGKIDEKKFTRLGAWVVSTWGFVYLIIDQRFSEWYFTGYMALWVGNAILEKYMSRDQQNSNKEQER